MSSTGPPRTLYDKIWDDHVVDTFDDGTCLLAVDRELIYEATSFQAFEALRTSGGRCAGQRPPRRP